MSCKNFMWGSTNVDLNRQHLPLPMKLGLRHSGILRLEISPLLPEGQRVTEESPALGKICGPLPDPNRKRVGIWKREKDIQLQRISATEKNFTEAF
jgi:hypothetical protein